MSDEARRWFAQFMVGDIVRGPYGRRYLVVEANHERHMYLVRRAKADGQPDKRCGLYNFPAGYLSRIEVQP